MPPKNNDSGFDWTSRKFNMGSLYWIFLLLFFGYPVLKMVDFSNFKKKKKFLRVLRLNMAAETNDGEENSISQKIIFQTFWDRKNEKGE